MSAAEECSVCGDDGWEKGSDGSKWQHLWYCKSCWDEWDRMDMARKEEECARREEGQLDDEDEDFDDELGEPVDELDFQTFAAFFEEEDEDPELQRRLEAVFQLPIPNRPDGTPWPNVWQYADSWWREPEGNDAESDDLDAHHMDGDVRAAGEVERDENLAAGLHAGEEEEEPVATAVGPEEDDSPVNGMTGPRELLREDRLRQAAMEEPTMDSEGGDMPPLTTEFANTSDHVFFTFDDASSNAGAATEEAWEGDEELLRAAHRCELGAIEAALESGAFVDCRDDELNTPLLLFAKHCTIGACCPALELLLMASAGVHLCDKDGDTALLVAAGRANTTMVQSLLLHQADLEHENMHGDTALTMAAGTASTGLVRYLLRQNACITAPAEELLRRHPVLSSDEYIQEALSALHSTEAASSRNGVADDMIFATHVDVEEEVKSLMDRAEEGLKRIASLWQAVDELDIVALQSHQFSAEELNIRRQDGATPLMAVLSRATPMHADGAQAQIIQTLLSSQASVRTQNWLGESPLQLAARHNNQTLVEAILLMLADPNTYDRFSETPLTEAVVSGSSDTVKLLLSYKSLVSSEDLRMASAHTQSGDDTIERALRREAIAQRYDAGGSAPSNYEYAPVSGDTLRQETRRERAAILRAAEVDREYFNLRHPQQRPTAVDPPRYEPDIVE